MSAELAHVYQLDKCLDWINKNAFKRVVLQFKPENLEDSTHVVSYLEQAHRAVSNKTRPSDVNESLDLYVTQANTCSVDLIVTQHISNVDAIIHFGKACLSKPHLSNANEDKPILFAFTRIIPDEFFEKNLNQLIRQIEHLVSENSNCPVCLLYDTHLIDYAQNICDLLHDKGLDKSVEVAKLITPSSCWSTTASPSLLSDQSDHCLGQYALSKSIDHFKTAICLSNSPAINLILQLPSNVWKIGCLETMALEKVNVTRVLNKRMALVERLRDDEELKFGVIITNPLPNLDEIMPRLANYAKARRHILYLISMIQTIDECKIGNFDLCDAFIVVNSCTCSTILESLYFNRPIINELEFKLACGFEAEYGRVLWPCADSHLTEDDLINKRKVSDVSLALIHSRNEILERCATARASLWSGLDYKSNDETIDDVNDLTIKEGLQGIASAYTSEPSNIVDHQQ
jgi:diphthamide biosynthesis enzyme Dph1/Dph2-like protein